MARRRRKKHDRSVLPVLSMFIFGLFMVLGASPGSVIFDDIVNVISPSVQIALIAALAVSVYFLYNQVFVPLRHLCKAYRWGGIMAIIALSMAFLGGCLLLVDRMGMILFTLSLVLWKVTVYLSY